MSRRATRAQHGLSMVEVLAAMVIFSAGAAVLFSWIGQTAQRLGRLSSEQQMLFANLAAIEYANTLNPMLQPSGSVGLAEEVELSWTSQPVGDIEPMRTPGALYDVALYRVELKTQAPGGAPSVQSVYVAGWRQVRKPGSSNPLGLAP